MIPRHRLALMGCALFAACAPRVADPPGPLLASSASASASVAASSASADPRASASVAPVERASTAPPGASLPRALPGGDPARIAQLAFLARALLDTFDNVQPRPVTRGYTQQTWVQFETDKRTPGELRSVEAWTMDLHHPPSPASPFEPCKAPLAPGQSVEGVGRGSARLERDALHDTLFVSSWRRRDVPAALPRGRSHGACLGPDGTRVWVAWSTPDAPPELFSIALDSGKPRALRMDARPGLATLPPMKVAEAPGGLTLTPAGSARATVFVVEEGPVFGWSRAARFLVAAGIAVRRGGAPRDGEAVVEVGGATGPFVLRGGGERSVLSSHDGDGAIVPEGRDARARASEALAQIADRVLQQPGSTR